MGMLWRLWGVAVLLRWGGQGATLGCREGRTTGRECGVAMDLRALSKENGQVYLTAGITWVLVTE